MTPGLRLTREVARTPSACHRCAYPVVAYDARYVPRIGGVALHDGYCYPETGRLFRVDHTTGSCT